MISFLANASQVVLFLLGTFLIIVILLQRGRGGGLAGAFGGMGGQSAFGTKAGDVFTRITIVLAVCWVILAGGSGFLLRAASKGTRASAYGGDGAATTTEGTGSEGALGTAGGTAPDGTRPGGTESPAGTEATPAPSSGGGPATSGGTTAPEGTPAPTGTAAPEKDAQPAPASTPETGSTGTPSADTPVPASSTPGQPTPSPQDK